MHGHSLTIIIGKAGGPCAAIGESPLIGSSGVRDVRASWSRMLADATGQPRRGRPEGTLRESAGCVVAWHPWHMQSVYEAAGGSGGLLRLAEAWHSRVMADEIVSHAFSHGFHPQHSERLAAYWAEALGGPTTYSGVYGDETSVVRIHSGNGPHEEMDRRAIACFDQALQDVGLDAAGPLGQVLHDYFAWATTTTMSRYHDSADDVPEGLTIPRWSWDGLQP
jgi:hemoglobin